MSQWEDNMRNAATPDGIMTTTGGEAVEGGNWSDNWRNAWTPDGLKIVGNAGDTVNGDTVNLTGDQTIEDVKTFSSSPVVPTATTNTQAVNKAQMDAADTLKVDKAGDTMTGDLTLDSGDGISREINLVSGRPSDDIAGGTDGTSRINLYSYQRGYVNSFGENIRHYMMKKDAKSMDTYYFPSGGYDASGDPVGAMKPVVWHGAHWQANDHNSNHKHWSIETPDTTGAIQTRFEIRFGDPTNDSAIAGLNKTLIATNLADFVVRTSNGQVLRLSSSAGNHKPIEFNNDHEGATSSRRWVIRSNSTAETGANAGNDFQIVNYDDSGTLLSQALHVQRSTGNVILGSSTPTTGVKLDINGGRVRIRTSTPPTSATAVGEAGEIAWDTNYFYVCVATNTWKRTAISTW